jgi:hypothetical protein
MLGALAEFPFVTALDAWLVGVLALCVLLGRAILAQLPAGRIGAYARGDTLETLLVSAALGVWFFAVLFPVAAVGLSFGNSALGGTLVVAALLVLFVRPLLGPQSLAPQLDLPRQRRLWLQLLLAVPLTALWWLPAIPGPLGSPWLLPLALPSVAVVAASFHLTRAVENAGRSVATGTAVALAVLWPISPIGSYGVFGLLGLQMLAAFFATSLVGWLRRADLRDRALALFSAGILAGFDLRLSVAGFVATTLATHSNARKSTLKAAALALLIGAAPLIWLSRNVSPWFDDWERSVGGWGAPLALPLGLVVTLVGASVALRGRGRSESPTALFAPPGREVGALALFCAIPLLWAGLEQAVPSLALPEFAPLELATLVRVVAPAAVFLAAITLVPPRKP